MAELDARRTRHLRGEAPWVEDDGRFGPRTIGALALVQVGWEVWASEGGRLNSHGEPLGGLVVGVDAGGPPTVDEYGEIIKHPARFRCYDYLAPWPYKSFRALSEDEVTTVGLRVASTQRLVTAIRRFCREVGHGSLTLDAFEARLVTEAAHLVAVVMGGYVPQLPGPASPVPPSALEAGPALPRLSPESDDF